MGGMSAATEKFMRPTAAMKQPASAARYDAAAREIWFFIAITSVTAAKMEYGNGKKSVCDLKV